MKTLHITRQSGIYTTMRLVCWHFFESSFCDAVMQPNSYLSVKSRVMFSCGSFKIKQSPSDYRVLNYCEKCEL